MKKSILGLLTAVALTATLTGCGGGGSTTSTAPLATPPPAAAPTYKVTSFLPASGLLGDSITITGTDFPPAATVKFNGVAATITASTTTSLTVTVPTTATSGLIEVISGTQSAFTTALFTVTNPITPPVTTTPPVISPPPTITSLGVVNGYTAVGFIGDSVTITGANFTSQPTVQFNGVSASVTSYTATQIITKVPVGATSGLVAITIAGQTVMSASNYIVKLPSSVALNAFTVSETTYSTANPHALTGTYNVTFSSPVPNVQLYVVFTNTAVIPDACLGGGQVPVQPLMASIDFTEISATNKTGNYTTDVSTVWHMIQPTPVGILDYTKPTYIVATLCSYDMTQVISLTSKPIYFQSQKSVPITITP